jgi:hypothetical protein
MLLALASALAAQSVPPQPEARAIEAAQAEIETVPAAVREISRAEQRVPHYFLAPDGAKATRLAQAARTLIRYCRT